jgi:hypothetical protein
MDRSTTLSIKRGMRIISHFDANTGEVTEDTVTLLTETEQFTFEPNSFEWIAPPELANRNGGRHGNL